MMNFAGLGEEADDRFVVPLGTRGCALMLTPASFFIVVRALIID